MRQAWGKADWRASTYGLSCGQPRARRVKLLRGGEQGRWRARIGDYPIVYAIEDDHLIVLELRVGHRREVYEH